jgi:diguanylate cyclase (GGDEF)-like protein/PAS domain S-box-containing protein
LIEQLANLLSDPVDGTTDRAVRELLGQLPNAGVVAFDRELRLRLVEGPAAVRPSGLSTDAVRGRRVQDVVPAGSADVVVPHYHAALAGEERTFELAGATGRRFVINVGPVRDEHGDIVGGIALGIDITDRAMEEEAFAEAAAQYRLLAETASDVVSLHDTEGNCAWISPSVKPVFGYAPEDVIGRSVFELTHPDDREAVVNTLTVLESGRRATMIRFRALHADGRYGWVESSAAAVRTDDGGLEIRAASRDITARVERERRLEETQAALRRRLRQASAVAQLGERAAEHADACALMELAVKLVTETLDVPLGAIVEIRSRGQLLVRAGTGWEPGLVGDVVHASRGDFQETIEQIGGDTLVVHDAGNDLEADVLRRHGAVAGAQVLIGDRARPWGVLSAWCREPREFDEHDRDFLRSVGHIVGEAVVREAAHAAVLHEAMHDGVTGLPNRALLVDRLGHALDRRREGGRIAVLLFDLDGFKVVNDSMGHAVGDELLAAVGPRLTTVLRPGDTIARFGGDTFAVVCEDIRDEAHAQRLAERITAAFARPFVVGEHSFFVSASIGVVVAAGGDSAEDVLRDADAAVYRAKDAGRNRYELFDPGMRERVVRRLRVESELRKALAGDELDVHFQPIFALPDRRLAGVEALARWEHPERGPVSPADFIPVAEDTGLIVPLGTSILRAACRQAARWNEDVDLTVNLSARQVAQPELLRVVGQALEDSGLPASRLGLEITERLLMQDSEAVAATLRGLKELGVRLILDDFGTGYSSLSYLKRFPLDRLKIDRSFVAGVVEHDGDRAIVDAIVAMARALGLGVIPEGVENEDQLRVLVELGCRHAQGFLLGRPLPAAELEAAFPELSRG